MCIKCSPLPIPFPNAESALGVVHSGFMDDLLVYEARPKHTSIPNK